MHNIYKPGSYTLRDLSWAIDQYLAYRDLNLAPYPGGQEQQEAEWVDAVLCITSAFQAAKNWAEQLEQQEMQAKSKKKG